MKSNKRFLLTFVAIISTSMSLFASGSYQPSSPSSSQQKEERKEKQQRIEQGKYNLGQLLYSGKAKLRDDIISTEIHTNQTKTLTQWQAALPEKAGNQLQVQTMAGKLSKDQMAALKFYLQKRYKIKLKG